MTDPNLIVITKPMAHHGLRAGYNVLARYLEPDIVVRAAATPWGRTVNSVTRRGFRYLTGVEWYGAAGLLAEARAALHAGVRHAPTVIHVLYGEDLLWALPYLTGPQTRVVATFHQPPERFERLVRRLDHVRALDAVIALDPNNADRLESIAAGRVHTMTLGVDTDYWHPGPSRHPRRVLFVGNHLRDFDLLSAVVQRLAPQGVTFDLVVPATRRDQLRALPSTTLHTGIPDEALRTLYQDATLLFLPLRGGSANNAVMQALACGTPIVATDIPGLRSYVPASAGDFAPLGDVDAHLRAVLRLLEDPAAARSTQAAARARGEQMGWAHVALRHRALYKGL